MSMMSQKRVQSYWDTLPIELHEIILEFRDKILYHERQELLHSLSLEELLTSLDYKYCNILADSSCKAEYAIELSKIGSSVYKVPGRIFKISSYDISDVLDGIDLIINIERNHDNDGTPEKPIIAYWDASNELQMGVDAVECFNKMNQSDIERLMRNSEDDFINFADYCFDIFRDIYNNRKNY